MEGCFNLSIRLSNIEVSANSRDSKTQLLEEAYVNITEIVDEKDVHGIQLYPNKNNLKLQSFVKNHAVKDELLEKGVTIFNKHVDFEDNTGVPVIRVMVYDAPLMMSNEQMQLGSRPMRRCWQWKRNFCKSGAGWRHGPLEPALYICSMNKPISQHLTCYFQGMAISVNIWYRGQSVHNEGDIKCVKCGDTSHHGQACPATQKPCYTCHLPENISYKCPNNKDGNKRTAIR